MQHVADLRASTVAITAPAGGRLLVEPTIGGEQIERVAPPGNVRVLLGHVARIPPREQWARLVAVPLAESLETFVAAASERVRQREHIGHRWTRRRWWEGRQRLLTQVLRFEESDDALSLPVEPNWSHARVDRRRVSRTESRDASYGLSLQVSGTRSSVCTGTCGVWHGRHTARAGESCPPRVKPSQVESSQVEPGQVESNHVESSRITSSRVESRRVESMQVK